jgi:hypothetical protein
VKRPCAHPTEVTPGKSPLWTPSPRDTIRISYESPDRSRVSPERSIMPGRQRRRHRRPSWTDRSRSCAPILDHIPAHHRPSNAAVLEGTNLPGGQTLRNVVVEDPPFRVPLSSRRRGSSRYGPFTPFVTQAGDFRDTRTVLANVDTRSNILVNRREVGFDQGFGARYA